MKPRMPPAYEQLIEKANQSHEQNRNPAGISNEDVGRVRLYCFAYRPHTIGTFHATGLALRNRELALEKGWLVR